MAKEGTEVADMQSPENGQILLYQSEDGNVQVEVNLLKETLWLSQKQLADLFSTERSVVTKHINNITRSKELRKESGEYSRIPYRLPLFAILSLGFQRQ